MVASSSERYGSRLVELLVDEGVHPLLRYGSYIPAYIGFPVFIESKYP